MNQPINLHLVLTRHWYDETASGTKRIEYRVMTKKNDDGTVRQSKWARLIWAQRDLTKTVTFSRAMTKTTQRFAVVKIDIGPCPIPGWDGDFYRVHFEDFKTNTPGDDAINS